MEVDHKTTIVSDEPPVELKEGSDGVESTSQNDSASPPPKPRFFFRYRLWMLFLLFIPAAFYANQYRARTVVVYSESKDSFWKSNMNHLKFDKLPDGTPTVRGLNVDDAYQTKGVSFAFGTPDRDEASEAEGPATIPIVAISSTSNAAGAKAKVSVPSGSPLNPNFLKPKSAGNLAATKSKTDVKITHPGFIGISGYPFKFGSVASYPFSLCGYEQVGSFHKRFKGQITIRFHQPGKPDQSAGVKRIGFFAARLNHPETLEVRLYSPSGKFLCRQSNLTIPCAFMSFESNKKIGRIEIATIGQDEDYAITGLMYDKVK